MDAVPYSPKWRILILHITPDVWGLRPPTIHTNTSPYSPEPTKVHRDLAEYVILRHGKFLHKCHRMSWQMSPPKGGMKVRNHLFRSHVLAYASSVRTYQKCYENTKLPAPPVRDSLPSCAGTKHLILSPSRVTTYRVSTRRLVLVPLLSLSL